MSDLIDTSTTQGQKVWAGLCNHAFENLPTNTTVTFEDVDAILTWTLWRYEEITAPARTARAERAEAAMAEVLEAARDVLAHYRTGRLPVVIAALDRVVKNAGGPDAE